MISHYEDDLICDLAETYHILNYRVLPVKTTAVLACGLPEKSRVKMRMMEAKVDLETALICIAIDRLSTLVWMQSKDGGKGVNRPRSLLQELTEEGHKKRQKSFLSGADFEAAREKLLKKGR